MTAAARATSAFVSVDMEGCATLVHSNEVRPSADAAYARSRRIMTDEVNAVLAGARAAGVERAVVNDSHAYMRNLMLPDVDPHARVISGRAKPLFMLEGISRDSAAAFFVGYHGAIGDLETVMGHTYSPRVIFSCRLNGEAVGETTINAALAGHYGVPVALVSGDQATLAETRRNLPWAVGVQTKRSISAAAAECDSPATVLEALERGARQAIEGLGEMQPYLVRRPVLLEIDTQRTSQADMCELIPGMRRRAGRTIAFAADDVPTAYRALMNVIYLGSAA